MIVKSRAGQTGFTFIELAVSVAIVGLLATVVLPVAELAVKRNQEYELRLALRQIRTALDAYKRAVDEGRVTSEAGKSGYPPTLSVLADGVIDAHSADHDRKIYFLRRIPRDPMCLDSTRAPADTWGKRDYESGPDAPEEGDDVFDVYSQSEGTGLNGIPYKEW